jgi:anaerobic selenocysteine-containing dehydrogenase
MEHINLPLTSCDTEEPETPVFRTVCGICSGTCGITLTVKNGRVHTIEGDDDHPVSKGHLCPKGRAFTELLAAKDRLKHPLRRTATGEWEQISWNQAFDLLGMRLHEIKEVRGPEALAVHVGQAGVGKEFSAYVERFCNLYGTPNFSTSGSHCCESKSMANVITYGAMPIADYENSRCIVLWGKNPLSSTPSLVKEITGARARGCSLIVIDPRETALAQDADLHLQLRPGTDGALALAMLHVIAGEGLYNKEFVDAWTIGFDRLLDYVSDYTPERVERITWVPASRIREAARLYASSSPACISQGVSLELSTNGFQTLRAVAILQAITANLDIPGGAIFLKEAMLTDLRLISRNGGRQAIGAQEHPLFHASTGHAQANFYARAILEGKPYPLKGLVVAGSNPALTWPNAGKVRRALSKLDFIAVMDPFMTETARFAHLVLPCASFLGGNELWDSSHLSSEPRLGLAPKFCDDEGLPTNWEVWKEIATRMGYGESFPWETEEDAINFRLRSMGLTLDDLRGMPGGYVYHQWKAGKYEQEGFRTPSGKVEIYSAELEHYGYAPLPVYLEPAESPVSAPRIAASYPLVLTTGARTLGYLHSRFRNVPSLLNRAPEPYVEINTLTAAEFHVEDGEVVFVETRRGRIEVKVRCTPRILQNVISLPHGWDQANANVLTDDANADPVTGFPADRSLLARIVKRRQAI